MRVTGTSQLGRQVPQYEGQTPDPCHHVPHSYKPVPHPGGRVPHPGGRVPHPDSRLQHPGGRVSHSGGRVPPPRGPGRGRGPAVLRVMNFVNNTNFSCTKFGENPSLVFLWDNMWTKDGSGPEGQSPPPEPLRPEWLP